MFHHDWEPGTGTLIDTRYGGKHGDWSGNASVTANSVHYLMEVTPDSGGEPFRCECVPPSMMLSFKSPPFGKAVRMLCIPSQRKAKFDRDDPAISRHAEGVAHRDAYYAELDRPSADRTSERSAGS